MPALDVSSVLLDPLFVDRTLSCIRMTQTIDTHGRAADTPTTTTFFGVVTNDRGDVLVREAEGSRVEGSIVIHTRFRLLSGKTAKTADVVDWNGNQYTVVNVADYSTYGRGFVCANCELIPLSGGN